MRAIPIALPLLLCALALAPVQVASAGDPELAEFLFKQGEKAFRQKKYEDAAESYRKALEEQSPYPEACDGLGRALEKLGKKSEAIRAYRRCCEEIATLEEPTSRQRRLSRTVKKAIGKLCEGYSRLDELEERFVKDCLAFGRKNARDGRTWARCALEAARTLDPGNQGVRDQLAKLGPPDAAEEGFLSPLAQGLGAWELGMTRDVWSCRNGVVCLDRPGMVVHGWWKTNLEGSFALTGSLVVEKAHGDGWYAGVEFGEKFDPARGYGFSVAGGNRFQVLYHHGSKVDLLKSGQVFNWEIGQPLRFRVEVEPGKFRVLLGGTEVFAREGQGETEYDGRIGLAGKLVRVRVEDLRLER